MKGRERGREGDRVKVCEGRGERVRGERGKRGERRSGETKKNIKH